jgi:radical SAM protein with 4Fe4S-binding SPASM domain
MEKILDKENWDWDFEFYPPDTFNDGEYILSKYAILERVEDGFLLFHTITRAMYLLTCEEFYNILHNEELIKGHIVINSNVKEDDIAKRVYLHRAQSPLSDYSNLKHYVVFTTNNCNARCPYCYENNGVEKPIERGMTLKTAEKVVEYILKTKKEGKFEIEWFGGEPLLNQKVISYICKRIKEELGDSSDDFSSKIITNGLLFNKDVLNKSITDWNVDFVQITLDGIEDEYNEIKRYKNVKFNPFKKVVKNIESILKDSNITLTIRINASEDNIDNIEGTIQYIIEHFGIYIENKRLKIGLNPTFQLDSDDNKINSPVMNKISELKNKYNLINSKNNTLHHTPITHCMGDNGHAVAISPKGELNVCEHWEEKNIIGNVVDGITNQDVIKEWNTKDGENIEFCLSEKCPYLPICNHLTHCPSDPSCKSLARLNKIGKDYRLLMVKEYLKYKKKKEETKNGEE